MDYLDWAKKTFSIDRYAVKVSGVEIIAAGENYAKCRMNIEDMHLNGHDTVMGGAIFTLADYAFGVAANTPVRGCVTLSSSINFVRSAVGPALYAEARCVRNGKRIAFFNVTVTDDIGKTVAEAQFNGCRVEEVPM